MLGLGAAMVQPAEAQRRGVALASRLAHCSVSVSPGPTQAPHYYGGLAYYGRSATQVRADAHEWSAAAGTIGTAITCAVAANGVAGDRPFATETEAAKPLAS